MLRIKPLRPAQEDDPLSISPPSDIILDVAQAADPLQVQTATTRLAARAAGASGAETSFDTALRAAAPARPAGPLPVALRPPGPDRLGPPSKASTSQKFEAMVLQSFIENMLPKNAELFGDAQSADMGRSLLAEQIANQLAKSGRIGIAKTLERHADAAPPAADPPAAPAPSRG